MGKQREEQEEKFIFFLQIQALFNWEYNKDNITLCAWM